jgi:hypothetical protein
MSRPFGLQLGNQQNAALLNQFTGRKFFSITFCLTNNLQQVKASSPKSARDDTLSVAIYKTARKKER